MVHTKIKVPLCEIYRKIYPWRTLDDFVGSIKQTIAFRSEDNSLIAINKPFGVGTYTVNDCNKSKQNQDKVLYDLVGSPRYCLKDVLKPLSCELKSDQPYEIVKSIDRYMSGLVLLSNQIDLHKIAFTRSVSASRINKTPPFGFRALTSGYPLLNTDRIYEKVGVRMTEIDELGDHKEPVIVKELTQKFDDRNIHDAKSFQAELIIKKINRELSTALIELFVSKLSWDFSRCYISSKTSFILGDVRFSKRIRHILGRKIQVSPLKSSQKYQDDYEPLDEKLRQMLGIKRNSEIPLMLDLHCLRLKNFFPKKGNNNRDLRIESSFMPLHFAATMEVLNLIDDSSQTLYRSQVGDHR